MKRKIATILLAGGILIVGTGAYATTGNTNTTTGIAGVVCPYIGDRLKELTDVLRAKGKDSIADRIENGNYNNKREAITAVPEETEEIVDTLREEGLAGGGAGQNAGQGVGNGIGTRKLDGTGNPNGSMGNGTGTRKLDGTGNPNGSMGNGTGTRKLDGTGNPNGGMGRNR